MKQENLNATNKKSAGKGNGNSVIDNYEHKNAGPMNYTTGEPNSSSGHKFEDKSKLK